MNYLSPAEYEFIIRQDVMTHINQGSTTRLGKAEKAAAKFMMGHLGKRYDIAKTFYPVSEYQDGTYVIGQMVYYKLATENMQQYLVYEAVAAISPGDNPPDTNNSWVVTDKRNELVMMYLADITAYHYFAADSPVMNQNIKERYMEAKKWVVGVGNGDIVTDLCENSLTSEDEGFNDDIRFGGRCYEDNYW